MATAFISNMAKTCMHRDHWYVKKTKHTAQTGMLQQS